MIDIQTIEECQGIGPSRWMALILVSGLLVWAGRWSVRRSTAMQTARKYEKIIKTIMREWP